MQILKYGSEYSSNKCHINGYSDLYVEKSPIIFHQKNSSSVTKERVFPNRYIGKHTWNTYGYKTNYSSSFEEKNNCLHKKPRQGNFSFPSKHKSNSKLVGKIYKSKDEDNYIISKKSEATWNCPF